LPKTAPTKLGGTYQAFGYVIVEIDQDDLATSRLSKEWQQGFHLLDSEKSKPENFRAMKKSRKRYG
jgi:hypothetical protein